LNFTNGLRSKHPPIAEFSNFLPRTATCWTFRRLSIGVGTEQFFRGKENLMSDNVGPLRGPNSRWCLVCSVSSSLESEVTETFLRNSIHRYDVGKHDTENIFWRKYDDRIWKKNIKAWPKAHLRRGSNWVPLGREAWDTMRVRVRM
jgi:hypothetical protein